MKLEVKNINKSFATKQVLHDVSFDVSAGKALGFLGRNGAGKTTTIRSLMNVFKQDSGEFFLNGQPFDVNAVKIGYLPEERGLYSKEKIIDQLMYFAQLRGAERKSAKQSAEYWLKRFELDQYKNQKLETLSKGNQQKVQIAQALLNDPDIYIFDEPFSGLDPINAQVLKDVISEKIAEGKLVIFSSHQMAYVEEFCDDIAIIEQGRIICKGSLQSIKQTMGKGKVRLNLKEHTSLQTQQWIEKQFPQFECEYDKASAIVDLKGTTIKHFLSLCIQQDVEVESFEPYYPTLHEIFVKKVGESHA